MVEAGVKSYWQGHSVVTRKVVGSNPTAPANHGEDIYSGPLAQSVEHRTFNPQVLGSNPRRPTIEKPNDIRYLEEVK